MDCLTRSGRYRSKRSIDHNAWRLYGYTDRKQAEEKFRLLWSFAERDLEVGLGIPEYEAKRYEGKVKEGGILISVHSENNDETHSAKVIFKEEGAHDISSTGEAHADVQDEADESATASRLDKGSDLQEIAAPRVTREKQNAAFVTIEQIQRRRSSVSKCR
jgi:hypothetical protein